jgi:hypothetical protein
MAATTSVLASMADAFWTGFSLADSLLDLVVVSC